MKLFSKVVLLLYVVPAIGIGLALYRSWSPYSFWMDELGSVSMSVLPLTEVWQAIILDVHPPLFQLFLKLWVLSFGSWEPIVRFFSLACCLLASLYLYYQTRSLFFAARWIVITVFTSCFLFSFYAQEARSYGLTLLLSTLLTIQYAKYDAVRLDKKFLSMCAVAVALSLTHYFGLLLAVTILTLLTVEHRRNRQLATVSLAAIVFCMAWPLAHAWLGLGVLKSSKNAWMVVDGPLDTARIFFRTFLPGLNDFYLFIYAALIIIFVAYVGLTKASPVTNNVVSMRLGIYRLAGVCVSMLCGIAVIDSVTPISTERNFIVMLPTVSLLMGLCCERIFVAKPKLLSGLLLVGSLIWGINALLFSHYLLALKWAPQHNWRASAQFVVDNRTNEKLYYLRNRDEPEIERVFNFYIHKLSQGRLSLERIYIEQLVDIKEPAMLVLGGVGPGVFEDIKKRMGNRPLTVYQPPQSLNASTGVVRF
jgi:hypothetical protein